MDYNLITGIIAFMISYYVIRYFLFKKMNREVGYEKEMTDILNKDDYKVKGRFE